MIDPTQQQLSELQTYNDREQQIVDDLIRQGAAMEEAERRANLVTVADLTALSAGIASLEGAIGALKEDVARASQAALPPVLTATGSGNGGNGNGNGTTAPPPSPLSFAELEQRIRKNDAEEAELLAALHDRLTALGAIHPDSVLTAAPPVPGTPVAGVISTPIAIAATPERTFMLQVQPMTGEDVRRFQADLNARFAKWQINIHVAEDGRYAKATCLAARRAMLGLGVAPEEYEHGMTPPLRALVKTPSLRTPEQKANAELRRPWLRRLRTREAAEPARHGHAVKPHHDAPASRPHAAATPAHVPGSQAAIIRKHGGRYEDAIIREAHASGLELSLVCALIEHESGFRNVYGHDPVPNPIKSPPNGLREVTEENYRLYLRHRRNKEGMQGVGPTQLTWFEFQDEADAAGGCWKPEVNIKIGCRVVARERARLGSTRQALRVYNGGPTPPASTEGYARSVLKLQQKWQHLLAGAKVVAPANPSHPSHSPNPSHAPHPSHAAPAAGHPGKPRTFKLVNPAMHGEDVKRFQHDVNARLGALKIEARISEDGRYGSTTRQAAVQVMLCLGIATTEWDKGITPALRMKIRDPRRCTPAEVSRAKTRGPYADKLRKRMKGRGALRLRAYAEAKRMLNMHVTESGGENHGTKVLEIISSNGGHGPEAWCGDFQAWCYRRAGSKITSGSWAGVRNIGGIGGVKRTKKPLKGDLVTFNFGGGSPKHDHVGMFVCFCDSSGRPVAQGGAGYVKSIDGNTPRQNGGPDGIWEKVRPIGPVTAFLRITR
jgi:hypothetical protein